MRANNTDFFEILFNFNLPIMYGMLVILFITLVATVYASSRWHIIVPAVAFTSIGLLHINPFIILSVLTAWCVCRVLERFFMKGVSSPKGTSNKWID
jgi:hypothetical protein